MGQWSLHIENSYLYGRDQSSLCRWQRRVLWVLPVFLVPVPTRPPWLFSITAQSSPRITGGWNLLFLEQIPQLCNLGLVSAFHSFLCTPPSGTQVWHCLSPRSSSFLSQPDEALWLWGGMVLTPPAQGLLSHPSLLSTCFSLLYDICPSKNTHNLSRTNSHFSGQLV